MEPITECPECGAELHEHEDGLICDECGWELEDEE